MRIRRLYSNIVCITARDIDETRDIIGRIMSYPEEPSDHFPVHAAALDFRGLGETLAELIPLTAGEQKLNRAILRGKLKQGDWVVVCRQGDKESLQHELCHALYEWLPEFSMEMRGLINLIRPEILQNIIDELAVHGYNKRDDSEIAAYLATSSAKTLRDMFGSNVTLNMVAPFRKLFKMYLKDYK